MTVAKRGRVSAAALEVATVTPLGVQHRVKPPHELNDEETEVWFAVVNAEPADWFSPSTVPLLTQYCRHVVSAKRVAELIERASGDSEFSVSDYDKLLHMQERESRTIATLATKMRLSQQSTINQRGNKAPTQARKLWDRR